MKTKYSIKIKDKTYFYTLEKEKGGLVHVVIKSAGINQNFLKEDISDLILDLPYLIEAEKEYVAKQNKVIRFRISVSDKIKIEKKASEKGYSSISKYLRDLALS